MNTFLEIDSFFNYVYWLEQENIQRFVSNVKYPVRKTVSDAFILERRNTCVFFASSYQQLTQEIRTTNVW